MKNIPIKDKSVIIQIKETYRTNGNVRGLLLFLLSINTGIKLVDLLKLTVVDVRDKDYISTKDNTDSYKYPVNKEIKKLISKFIDGRYDKEFLFKTRNGKPIDRIRVYREFKEICKSLYLGDGYSVTSWRKTFGYHYYKKYKDLTFLQWMFNQTSVEETLKYIDVEADFKSKVQVSLGL